jgi:hypothetical protein
MTSEITFVVSMVVKAPSACLAPYKVFVDVGAPSIQVQ